MEIVKHIHEWEELVFTPEEFFSYAAQLKDADCNIVLSFDSGVYIADEIWRVDERGTIYGSSYQNGILEYVYGQYLLNFHFSQTKLGQLKSVSITNEGVISALKDKI